MATIQARVEVRRSRVEVGGIGVEISALVGSYTSRMPNLHPIDPIITNACARIYISSCHPKYTLPDLLLRTTWLHNMDMIYGMKAFRGGRRGGHPRCGEKRPSRFSRIDSIEGHIWCTSVNASTTVVLQ